MAKRAYYQFCGLARAIEMIGERWALLIVRDLLVGPKRYSDLRQGLPRIPTNILAHRLKELEGAGVVRRQVLQRPENGVAYELTEYGAELEEVVLRLGRWGARSLGEPGPGDIVTVDSLIMAMHAAFRPEAAEGLDVSYEVRLGEIVVQIGIEDGTLEVWEGRLPDADLVIETGPAIQALLSGKISPADAIETGAVRLTGDPKLLTRFVEVFAV